MATFPGGTQRIERNSYGVATRVTRTYRDIDCIGFVGTRLGQCSRTGKLRVDTTARWRAHQGGIDAKLGEWVDKCKSGQAGAFSCVAANTLLQGTTIARARAEARNCPLSQCGDYGAAIYDPLAQELITLPAQLAAGLVASKLLARIGASAVAAEGPSLAGLSVDSAQLAAKFKHAADFGVVEARGAAGFRSFGKAVDSFVADSDTVRALGTYRGAPAILNYNAATAQVVVQNTVIKRGSLGGG